MYEEEMVPIDWAFWKLEIFAEGSNDGWAPWPSDWPLPEYRHSDSSPLEPAILIAIEQGDGIEYRIRALYSGEVTTEGSTFDCCGQCGVYAPDALSDEGFCNDCCGIGTV